MGSHKVLHVTRCFLKNGESVFAVIVLNAEVPVCDRRLVQLWRNAAFRACTDGAGNLLYKLCRSNENFPLPHLLSGDFDSIKPEALDYFRSNDVTITETADQNSTDFTKCTSLVIESVKNMTPPIDYIIAIGGLSGRFDHVMASLNTLVLISKKTDLPLFLLEDNSLVIFLPAGHYDLKVDLELITGSCGIIPLGEPVSSVKTEGLKYNLNGDGMAFGQVVSTSNHVLSSPIRVQSTGPLLWTFQLLRDQNEHVNGVSS